MKSKSVFNLSEGEPSQASVDVTSQSIASLPVGVDSVLLLRSLLLSFIGYNSHTIKFTHFECTIQ